MKPGAGRSQHQYRQERQHFVKRGDMENLGSLAILLAFCLALYATRRPASSAA